MRKITLNLVAHNRDCGDGSTAVSLYNSREELDAALVAEESSNSVALIESYDDPYENGTLSDVVMELEIDEQTGAIRLLESVCFSSDG